MILYVCLYVSLSLSLSMNVSICGCVTGGYPGGRVALSTLLLSDMNIVGWDPTGSYGISRDLTGCFAMFWSFFLESQQILVKIVKDMLKGILSNLT